MKKQVLKRILTTALATAMVMASTMTAFAAEGSNGSNSGSTPSSPVPTTTTEVSVSSDVEEVTVVVSNAVINVAGTKVRTSVAGVYLTKMLQGAAVITPLASIKAELGLSANQTPYVILYDTDTKKSTRAMTSINAALEAYGGSFVSALNIDLGAKKNGKFESLKNGSVNMMVGLPKKCDTTKEYSVILVQPGGAITLLNDLDPDPNTVTFNVKAGLGTYALVQKNS